MSRPNGFLDLRPPAFKTPQELHKRAIYTLANAAHTPDFDQIERDLRSEPVSSEVLKNELESMTKNFHDEIGGIYDEIAAKYKQEQLERWQCAPTEPSAPDRLNPHYKPILQTHDRILQMQWTDDVARCKYRHLKKLVAQRARILDADKREKIARERESQTFPQTIEEYRSRPPIIRNQVNICLVGDSIKKNIAMKNRGWTLQDMAPLVKIVESNEGFKTEVLNAFMMKTVDPRRKG